MLQSILPFYKHCLASFKDSVRARMACITQYLECCTPVNAVNHHKSSICNTVFVMVLGRQQRCINLSSCQSTFLIRHFYVPYEGKMPT